MHQLQKNMQKTKMQSSSVTCAVGLIHGRIIASFSLKQ